MEMIYTSRRGKQITFDDFEDNTEEYGTYWVEMCPHCHNKYKNIIKGKVSDGAMGTCSVAGCYNEANYYVDFNTTEVQIRRKNLWVCDHCLAAIESREGTQCTLKHYIDEGNSECDWCNDVGFDVLYELR